MVREVYSKAGFRWRVEKTGPERSFRFVII